MPKACKISHSRYFLSTLPYRTLCDLTVKDRIYTVLPLYHSAAGLLGVGAALSSGATMVLRKKFSASNFTSDCLKHRITSFQYIGELCRYLIAAPGNVLDFQLSSIRTCFGNGMRPDVWVKFQKRYSVKHVVEFYGATEGNASLFNNFDKVGSLGFVPRLLDALHPLKILRTEADDQTKPLRDANGKCVECRVGEVGLLVSQIYPSRKFDGYTDAKATNDKILRDVLVKEDMFFNTGDLLYRDGPGFFYWSDRIGDTFRWKGENCATSEVGAVLAACVGVKDVTVYGVSVPGCDGRAGMGVIAMSAANASGAAGGIQTDAASKDVKTVDVSAEVVAEMLKDVVRNCKQHLASYSRPLFLRVKASGTQLLTTTTFKHIKTDLVKEVTVICL
jgi:acyl-CoA synthetase (AMP-forming)/AMP-acid ligase II